MATARTLIFCTSYADRPKKWTYRWKRWLEAVKQSGLDYSQILIVDDASPIVPSWEGICLVGEHQEIPSAPICLYRFSERRGQNVGGEFAPGWYRSFAFACLYGIEQNFDKIVHVESDAFLISERAVSLFNNASSGWTSPWCARHLLPEDNLQVICKDQFPVCREFFSQPYGAHLGDEIERLVPFTNVERGLVGDRYGEYLDHVPHDADYVAQVYGRLWDQPPSYFWWLKTAN